MANSIHYDCKPALRSPVVIEGLPGVGNVGKLAADLMAEKLGARRMARYHSHDLPPQVIVGDDCVVRPACIDIYYADIGDRDLILLLGDYQGTTPNGQYDTCDDIMQMLLPYEPSLILTLGGYGTGQLVPAPRVLGAVTDESMKPGLEEAGVGFYPGEPQGGIVGAAAVFLILGGIYGIPSACIIGETSGYIVDHRSARHVLDCVCALLGIHVDASSFQGYIDQIEASIVAPEPECRPEQDGEDLVYIH